MQNQSFHQGLFGYWQPCYLAMSTWLYTGNSNWTCPKQTPDTPLLGSSWHLQEPCPHTSSVQVNSLGIILSWAPPPRPHASKSQASPRGSLFQIQLGWAYFSLPPRSQSWPSQLLTGRKRPVNKPGVVCIPPLQSWTAVTLVFSLVFHSKRRLCLWVCAPAIPSTWKPFCSVSCCLLFPFSERVSPNTLLNYSASFFSPSSLVWFFPHSTCYLLMCHFLYFHISSFHLGPRTPKRRYVLGGGCCAEIPPGLLTDLSPGCRTPPGL